MTHTVLARKWRPKRFADLVGQDHTVTILKNLIKLQRIHHAFLLTGTRGVGKTTIARIIAKALNCKQSIEHEPCGTCGNCIEIDNSSFIDVIEIDAASNTGVDNIRELIDNAQYAPTLGKYKIYIIDEVHMLSKSAFNAMLKTLEEPPQHVIFILATTDPQKVPITILSRCMQLKLKHLVISELITHLTNILTQEKIEFEEEALNLIATSAKGSARDALSLLDQAIAFANQAVSLEQVTKMLGITDDTFILQILEALVNMDSIKLVDIAKYLYSNGQDLENVLQKLSLSLCNLSLIQLAGYKSPENLQQYATKISVNDVQLYFEIVNLGLEQITKVVDKYPVFIMTLLRMLAFNIGTNEYKNTLVTHSNFVANNNINNTTNIIDPAEKININSTKNQFPLETTLKDTVKLNTQLPVKKIEIQAPVNEIIKESKHRSITGIKDFDGNWFSLITNLQSKLAHLYPILENSKLSNYTNDKFSVIIDSRYESIVKSTRIDELTTIFSEFFNRKILVEVSFDQNLQGTLKEKIIQEKQEKQLLIETKIKEDKNLARILTKFSAKITSGSIKPII